MANFNFNRVMLGGRLVTEPELKNTPKGTCVCSFNISVKRGRAQSGSRMEETCDYVRIVAWDKTAEFVSRWFHKGDAIHLVGKLRTRSFENENGEKQYITEIVSDEINFVDSRKEKEAASDDMSD